MAAQLTESSPEKEVNSVLVPWWNSLWISDDARVVHTRVKQWIWRQFRLIACVSFEQHMKIEYWTNWPSDSTNSCRYSGSDYQSWSLRSKPKLVNALRPEQKRYVGKSATCELRGRGLSCKRRKSLQKGKGSLLSVPSCRSNWSNAKCAGRRLGICM